MPSSENILVTGATGQVGRAVLDELRSIGAPVRAGARTPGKLSVSGDVEVVPADLTEPATLSAALEGVDKVFLYAVPQGVFDFLSAAQVAGVKHIVVLSSQTVVDNFPAQEPIVEMHRVVEKAVVDSAIPYTFLRPHNFATNILMWGWGESIRETGRLRFPYPDSHSDAVHEKDIAEVAAKVLTEPGHEGRSYFVSGPESITQRRQLEVIAEVTGRPLRFDELTPEQAHTELAPYVPEWVRAAVFGYWAASNGVPTDLSDDVKKITGHPARSFAEWVADHIEEFTP
ncbi:NAD(P)H-binding protein [Sphaerimonospora thailandensis]|uniref:Nucleotide-diphosphate-sugar epimerase n=1 Tax=Sphaerimonospora thailandensis TaxID=795644 RepID=A0A8J3VX26_9ACTN|nr:NAD(P)H-binding protein [Sphaerimonospora thailandensis]GIH67982.1 nucleotide-diphosphate-sugar epimerase [Sphaerimonospora thailandensis]